MESRTKNRKTRDQIAHMVRFAFGGAEISSSEDAMSELKEGWFNAAYQIRLAGGKDVVLKVAPAPGIQLMRYEANIMATEVACIRMVRGNSLIPVPEVYVFDDSHEVCDASYFFMEKISGDNLGLVKNGMPDDVMEAAEARIGEIIREINSFRGVCFGYDGNPDLQANTWRDAFTKIVDSVLQDAADKGAVFEFDYDAIRAAVLKHADALGEVAQPRLVHWDGWDSNFFIRDARIVGIIDFERALWADPLMEAQFRPFLVRDGGVNHYARGYGKTSFTGAETQRCHLYALHLGLVMHTECYYRNYDTDRVFELSRALIRHSMNWLEAN